MKAPVQRLSVAEVKKQFPIEGEVDGWFFRVDEVSAGVCAVEGTDLFGRRVSRTGVDPDLLLASCAIDARAIVTREKA